MYFFQHCFICRPSDSSEWEDAGIEPRKVATSAFAVIRCSHSPTSHPQLGHISSTTRLHLIHTRLHLIHTRLHLIHFIFVLFAMLGIRFSKCVPPFLSKGFVFVVFCMQKKERYKCQLVSFDSDRYVNNWAIF